MDNTSIVTFITERGEDFDGFNIHVEDGDAFTDSDSVVCRFKKSINASIVPPKNWDENFTVNGVFSPAEGVNPARFTVSLTASQTAAIDAGEYITTPEITISGGSTIVGSPIVVSVKETTKT